MIQDSIEISIVFIIILVFFINTVFQLHLVSICYY